MGVDGGSCVHTYICVCMRISLTYTRICVHTHVYAYIPMHIITAPMHIIIVYLHPYALLLVFSPLQEQDVLGACLFAALFCIGVRAYALRHLLRCFATHFASVCT